MLKIKDKIHISNLKNYGFIKYEDNDNGETYYCFSNLFVGEDKLIKQDDGLNCCRDIDYRINEIEMNVLFNLIQDDLVEKVVE